MPGCRPLGAGFAGGGATSPKNNQGRIPWRIVNKKRKKNVLRIAEKNPKKYVGRGRKLLINQKYFVGSTHHDGMLFLFLFSFKV